MTGLKTPVETRRPAAPPPRVRRYRETPSVSEPRSRVNTAIISIVVAVLIAAVGMLYLFQTNHVAGLGYEMSQLQRERATLSLRNEQLNYAVARYESLNRVESVALGQLNMQLSDDFIFVDVSRPDLEQLPPPDHVPANSESVFDRVWSSLTGTSTAVSQPVQAGR
jgi:cell division protein FtsL